MTDPLSPIFRSAEQKSFHELRAEFREEHCQQIASTLREDTITFRDSSGNYLRDKNGEIIERKTGYLTDREFGRDHRRLDEFIKDGGAVPAFSDDFLIKGFDAGSHEDFSGLVRELRDLARDAEAMDLADGVKHPDAPSLEGPAVESLDEGSLLDYTSKLVRDE